MAPDCSGLVLAFQDVSGFREMRKGDSGEVQSSFTPGNELTARSNRLPATTPGPGLRPPRRRTRTDPAPTFPLRAPTSSRPTVTSAREYSLAVPHLRSNLGDRVLAAAKRRDGAAARRIGPSQLTLQHCYEPPCEGGAGRDAQDDQGRGRLCRELVSMAERLSEA